MRRSASSARARSGAASATATFDSTVPGKQEHVLRDDRELSPQLVRLPAAHVLAEHADGAALRLVQAQQQARDGALARARSRRRARCARRGAPRATRRAAPASPACTRSRRAAGDALVRAARGARTARAAAPAGSTSFSSRSSKMRSAPAMRALQERVPLREQAHGLEELADVLRERHQQGERDGVIPDAPQPRNQRMLAMQRVLTISIDASSSAS